MKREHHYINSPWGPLKITANEYGLEAIAFEKKAARVSKTKKLPKVIAETEKWLKSYSKGKYENMPPIFLNGTSFQVKVWEKLLDIPPGKTKTYGEIAKAVGSPKAARAVGQACNVNPLAIIVPCHRVVGRSGLTGYAGGLKIKAKLITHEKEWTQ